MFKKPPQPKASANIKLSERRKLLSSICSTYDVDQASLTKEQERDLLPATTKQASYQSVQGHKGTIYLDENETPLWFKTRDSPLYPTVFTLWKASYLVPIINTHPHVIKVLNNGADLMLPGTVPPFDKRATRLKVVGVADTAKPTVIMAMGICLLEMPKYESVIGKTGVAVQILHHFDDELYKLNQLVDIPVPDEAKTSVLDVQRKDEEEEEEREEQEGETNEENGEQEKLQEHEKDSDSYEPQIDDFAETLSQLSVEDVDNFFTKSLFQTIKLDTLDLPMPSSSFMSNHIYKNLPDIDASYCNIKKTSWKKSAKFLKAMEKSKYLTVKGKGDDLTIVSVMSKTDPQIVNFVTHKTGGAKTLSAPKTNKRDKSKDVSVVQLYKPTSKSRPIYNTVDEDFTNYFYVTEVRATLEKYIKKKELVNPKDPKKINLDDTLKSVTQLPMGSHTRDKLFQSFLSNFSPHFAILKPGEALSADTALYKGAPPVIKIITQMKIGRKIITRVLNFEKFFIKPHILSDELKVKCSGSSTIGPCVENPALTEVTVQGPHGKTIIQLLNDKGITNTYIDFEDKVKKKKRK